MSHKIEETVTNEKSTHLTFALVALVIGLILAPLQIILDAWVLKTIWAWYMVPGFTWLPLTWFQALGIGFLVMWFKYPNPFKREPTDSEKVKYERLKQDFGTTLGYPIVSLIILFMAWIFKICF